MGEPAADRVIADGWRWIDDNEATLVGLLEKLVGRPGVSGAEGTHDDPGSTVGHLWSFLRDRAGDGVGLYHQRIPDGPGEQESDADSPPAAGPAGPPRENVYAVLPGTGRDALVCTSHTDTVPPGQADDWPGGDPFALRSGTAVRRQRCRVELAVDGETVVRPIREGFDRNWSLRGGDPVPVLVGRGAYDNLSAAVCLAGAMLGLSTALAGSERSLGGDLVHGHLVGEEYHQVGAKHMVGWEGYENWLGDRYPRPERLAAVVVEGSYGFVPAVGHRGMLWLYLRADGRSAHASTPDLGANAVLGMSKALAAMDTDEFTDALGAFFPNDPLLGEPSVCLGTTVVGGGVHGVAEETGAVEREGLNVVPDWCEATVDLRIPRWHDYPDHGGIRDRVTRLVEQFASEVDDDVSFTASVHPDEYCPPVALTADLESARDHPLVATATEVTEACFGIRPDPVVVPGGTDATVIVRCTGMPTLVEYGPAGGLSHQPWEFVDREQLIGGAKAMLAFAVRHLGIEEDSTDRETTDPHREEESGSREPHGNGEADRS